MRLHSLLFVFEDIKITIAPDIFIVINIAAIFVDALIRQIQVSKLLLIPSMKTKKVLEPCWYGWKEDKEFAREQLNGCR